VPVSGALDEYALRVANALVGNDEDAAALEMTVIGPGVTFLDRTWIAVTGGDLSPRLDGEPLPAWRAIEVRERSRLTFHGMRDGMRAYLAVAGGIDVPVVMGSRSTYVKGGFGGFEGRPLKKGDVLSTLPVGPQPAFAPRRLPDGHTVPIYGDSHELRVVLGPQDDLIGPEGVATLLDCTFEVSLDSDRMGYLLSGPPIKHSGGPDIVSDGNPPGAVQVPGDGAPTVLLADRGTTGGYTKIATVITVDIGRLAQAVPGNTVSFTQVDVEEAHRLLSRRDAIFADMSSVVDEPALSITVDGQAYEVSDEDGEPLTRTGPEGGFASRASHTARATVGEATYDFRVEIGRGGESQA
jgi:biotin-dependent carboxylase-like uncharacterized protein